MAPCRVVPETAPAARRRAAAAFARLAPVVGELGRRFAAAEHQLALVGGPVRDAFLGRSAPDLDFATDAVPEVTERLLAGWAEATWDVGRRFGTIGARRGDLVVEVTTYRTDSYDGTSRKPEVVFGTSLVDDLERRDFTINAMALRLPEMEFVDPFGGVDDLVARRLRTPGPAERSFDDDPLRMMRAARFVSQLGVGVDDDVRRAAIAMAGRLGAVSAERVREELVKLVQGRSPRAGIEFLVEAGLADHVLPELPALRLEIDEHHRHKDVYEHSLVVLDRAVALEDDHRDPEAEVPGPDFVLRFAALMHDIGKPATRRFEPGGKVSFHHHEIVGAKMTVARMRALKFDKQTTKDVARLVELHLRFHGYAEGQWSDSAVRRYVTDAGPLLARLHRLTRSDCTTRNRIKADRLARAYDDLERRIRELAEQEEMSRVRPDLDGNRIMELLGLAPGPVVGRAYRHLLELRMDKGPLTSEEAEAELRRWWAEQPEFAAG
ncbi:MAG: CCA tRNA nucleotidyltransferase [Kineosporiaceae bacterium]